MKKHLIEFSTITKHCFLGILLCFSTTLMAQKNTAEVKKIDDAVSQLYEAMVDRNKDKLEELAMESLTYGHSSGKIENKKEYVDGARLRPSAPNNPKRAILGGVSIHRRAPLNHLTQKSGAW